MRLRIVVDIISRKPRGRWLGSRCVGPTAGRPSTDHAPTGGRPRIVCPRPRAVVGMAQRFDVGQPGEAQRTIGVADVVDQLVVEAAGFRAMSDEVFEFDQARQVQLQLRVTPVDRLAQRAPAEAHVSALERVAHALGAHVPVDQHQQAPCLRRQFVEAAPEHVVRDRVRMRDVIERRLDVLDALSACLRGEISFDRFTRRLRLHRAHRWAN